MLPILGVSSSGYYDWVKRPISNQERKKIQVKKEIKKIHEASFKIYGAPKITAVLHKSGISISERTVSGYMKEDEIRARYRKPYTATTIHSNFSNQLKDILKRDFKPDSPNTVWCTDITYVWTRVGFVYLTSVMDLYSKKIIAWELSENLNTDSVVKCIEKAKRRRITDEPVIIHSDRGSQYISKKYLEVCGEALIPSYSRKGNPWDNACIESFHAVIKREWLNFYDIQNLNHAHQIIFEYIETFYNTVRIHGSCDYKSPNDYEKQYRLPSTH